MTRSTTSLGEVRQPRAPAVLVEIGYHDNEADARWIESHIDAIGQSLAMSMAEYFGLPFTYPGPSQPGVIATESGVLILKDSVYISDKDKTESRRKRILALQEDLWA